jgi:GT2 family glycosyltransferase
LQNSISYKSLLGQVSSSSFFIYDNSPLPDCVSDLGSVHYISDSCNSGLGVAYNKAARYANEKSKKWMLLSDQDSLFPANFITILVESIRFNQNISLFCPVLVSNKINLSPCYFILGKGFPIKDMNSGAQSLFGKSVLNSGLTIKLDNFIELGGYNEEIKLDYSDHEFISRYKIRYKECFVIPIKVKHSFSSFESNADNSLVRFNYYCQGAWWFSKRSITRLSIIVALIRAIKLTIHFRSIRFFVIYLKNFR